eukprot:gnl/Spiro4/13240_TR7027_c0_g1_i1.p1 gnl/Spiro4/13240_TR7027_c0_g1~~gnl/Spiro4/13240_TR7027_c0_g1_i1.p1  ORF type:complete len:295 (-),score=96.44 gnl/Spiro4/13240_TR7027_c0_g1_i1:175-1008(-)
MGCGAPTVAKAPEKAMNKPNEGQVGGHGGAAGLKFEGDRVLKPVHGAADKELLFYQAASKIPFVTSHNIIPRYYGCEERDTEWGKINYLMMANTTYGMRHPSILDLKLGTQTWDEDCSQEKRAGHIQRDNETTSAQFGFRFCGMKVYNAQTKEFKKFPKNFGWDANGDINKLQASLETFLHNGMRLRTDCIAQWVPTMQKTREFLQMGTYRFHAASFLFAYDDDTSGPAGAPPSCVLIDFAHAWPLPPGSPPDDKTIKGVDTILELFAKIQAKAGHS